MCKTCFTISSSMSVFETLNLGSWVEFLTAKQLSFTNSIVLRIFCCLLTEPPLAWCKPSNHKSVESPVFYECFPIVPKLFNYLLLMPASAGFKTLNTKNSVLSLLNNCVKGFLSVFSVCQREKDLNPFPWNHALIVLLLCSNFF